MRRSADTYLLQLFSGESLMPSMALVPGLKKLSLKNFRKCGRFLIKLLLTSFSFSLIWLSSSMLVAFDFDLNVVAGAAAVLANVDGLRQAFCVPNNPIMSNSYRIKLDRCRTWLSKFLRCASHYYNLSPFAHSLVHIMWDFRRRRARLIKALMNIRFATYPVTRVARIKNINGILIAVQNHLVHFCKGKRYMRPSVIIVVLQLVL